MTEASAFTITELTGARRSLTLVGRGLPYRPYTLKTKQRLELTWYPGNPVATATVAGAAEDPTTIQGAWKDKFIGDQTVPAISFAGSPVTNVRDAADIVDDLVRSGRLLEVTWDLTTRHGHIESFEKNWENVRDLMWSMTFQWISRGEAVSPVVLVIDIAVGDAAGTLRQLYEDLEAVAEAPFPTSAGFQDRVRNGLGLIEQSTNEMFATAGNLARQALSPVDAVRRAIALASNLIFQATDFIAFIKAEVAAFVNVGAALGSLSFQSKLAAELYTRTLIDRTRDIRDAAVQQRSLLARQIRSELLATYTAREGDDLRELSQRYYNSPFEWRRLMVFNSFTSSVLKQGQLVLIPKFTDGELAKVC